jgi:SAM-dependent methyltransferase
MQQQFWENVWRKSSPVYRSRTQTNDLPWEIFTYDPYLPLIIQELQNKSGKLLDIGCGSGYDTKFFHDNGYDALGVDIAANAINIAKNNFNDVKFEHKDVLFDKFDSDFNVIYDRGCVHNFNRNGIFCDNIAKKLFLKFYNMLSVGGEFILMTGNINEIADPSTTQSPKMKISEIEDVVFPMFRIKFIREIDFFQNKNYGNCLGWIFIMEKS